MIILLILIASIRLVYEIVLTVANIYRKIIKKKKLTSDRIRYTFTTNTNILLHSLTLKGHDNLVHKNANQSLSKRL